MTYNTTKPEKDGKVYHIDELTDVYWNSERSVWVVIDLEGHEAGLHERIMIVDDTWSAKECGGSVDVNVIDFEELEAQHEIIFDSGPTEKEREATWPEITPRG